MRSSGKNALIQSIDIVVLVNKNYDNFTFKMIILINTFNDFDNKNIYGFNTNLIFLTNSIF